MSAGETNPTQGGAAPEGRPPRRAIPRTAGAARRAVGRAARTVRRGLPWLVSGSALVVLALWFGPGLAGMAGVRTTTWTGGDGLALGGPSLRIREVLWETPVAVPLEADGRDVYAPRPGLRPGELLVAVGRPDVSARSRDAADDADRAVRTRRLAGARRAAEERLRRAASAGGIASGASAPDGDPVPPASFVEAPALERALGATVGPDGRLWFASDRAGGLGGYDLWFVRPAAGGGWSAPENAGPQVNSPHDEFAPAPTADGRTLWFASTRPHERVDGDRAAEGDDGRDTAWPVTVRAPREVRPGPDHDLYLVRLDAERGIQPARRVHALCTPQHDGTPAPTPSGDFLYFSSDRPGGEGGLDLWRVRILAGPDAPSGLVLGRIENLGRPVNTPADEADPWLVEGGFRLWFATSAPDEAAPDARVAAAVDSASPPRWRLAHARSREVERTVAWGVPAIDWRRLLPFLPWLVLLALLLLLLLLARRFEVGRRLGTLGLLARCVLASLLVHALLALLLGAWVVSGVLDGVDAGSGRGHRVVLSSSSARGAAGAVAELEAQVRGTFTDSIAADAAAAPTTARSRPTEPAAPEDAGAATAAPTIDPGRTRVQLAARTSDAPAPRPDAVRAAAATDASIEAAPPEAVAAVPRSAARRRVEAGPTPTAPGAGRRSPGDAPARDAIPHAPARPDESASEATVAPAVDAAAVASAAAAAVPSTVAPAPRGRATALARRAPGALARPEVLLDPVRPVPPSAAGPDAVAAAPSLGAPDARPMRPPSRTAPAVRDVDDARIVPAEVAAAPLPAAAPARDPAAADLAAAPLARAADEVPAATTATAARTAVSDTLPVEAPALPALRAAQRGTDATRATVDDPAEPAAGASPALRRAGARDLAVGTPVADAREDPPIEASLPAPSSPATSAAAPPARLARADDPRTGADRIASARPAVETPVAETALPLPGARNADRTARTTDAPEPPAAPAPSGIALERDRPEPAATASTIEASAPAAPGAPATAPQRAAAVAPDDRLAPADDRGAPAAGTVASARVPSADDPAAALPLPVPAPAPAGDVDAERAGGIVGRVTDASGRPVAGAEVLLDVEGPGDVIRAVADAGGRYRLPAIEGPDHVAVTAIAEGFVPGSIDVAMDEARRRTVRADVVLLPRRPDVIALEASPEVHHLGDDRFSGRINSRFQKASEGLVWRSRFELDAADLAGREGRATLRMLVRGAQLGNAIVVNGRSIPGGLDESPADGRFGTFEASFPLRWLAVGTNRVRIRSAEGPIDHDDFEFVNVQVVLPPRGD